MNPLELTLGIMTAVGGFVDISELVLAAYLTRWPYLLMAILMTVVLIASICLLPFKWIERVYGLLGLFIVFALRDKLARTLDGEKLDRVHEVQSDKRKIVALMCGAPSLIERLTAKVQARRILWDQVVRVDKNGVVVGPGKASAARSRRDTRRPSGRQSKR